MLIFTRKSTGEVLYQSATSDQDPAGLTEWEFTYNVAPRHGVTRDQVEVTVLDERTETGKADAERALTDEVTRIGKTTGRPVFGAKRPRPTLPEHAQRRQNGTKRLAELRGKGAAAMTQAEKDEALDLMLLANTAPHQDPHPAPERAVTLPADHPSTGARQPRPVYSEGPTDPASRPTPTSGG